MDTFRPAGGVLNISTGTHSGDKGVHGEQGTAAEGAGGVHYLQYNEHIGKQGYNFSNPYQYWDEYVDSNYTWPDRALPRNAQIGLITLYSLTSCLAIVGNITAIVVLTLGNRSRTDLSRYLVNLAVADLCMACFCIPFTFTKSMLDRWLFGSVMCPLVLFIQVLSVAVSIFTNTAIGIDR